MSDQNPKPETPASESTATPLAEVSRPEEAQAPSLSALVASLQEEDVDETLLATTLSTAESDDIGHLLESIPEDLRHKVWEHLPAEMQWDVLHALQYETVRFLVASLEDEQRQVLQAHATPTDLLAFAEILPKGMVDAILLDQDEKIADELQQALAYEDDQIGRFITKQIMRVRPTISIDSLIQRIRKRETVKAIFVITSNGELLGHIPVYKAFLAASDASAESLMEEISAFDDEDTCADIVQNMHPDDDAGWYPVMRDGKIIGAIPTTILLWELQETLLDASLLDAPSSEEDLFTPIPVAARLRAVWLCINLATAFLASWVIGMFEGAIHEVVALAILMPVVASMGGIGGSQTLAVALRGLALNHLTSANIKLLLNKETRIAMINGVILGVVIALVVSWWFDSWLLGLIIMIAISINSLAAAASGTVIPFLLKKVNIDPAIAGSVILTTVTDVVGFVVFLGLGSLILL